MHNIFIADDHTIVRYGLRRIIEEVSDYKVVGETGDGLQILPSVRKLRPDMVILDISMPNLRGIEAISKIRKVNKKVKILVLTMHKNEDYVCECLLSGAQGYILKEDADVELLAAMDSIKHNKVYVSPLFTSDVIKKLIQHRSVKRKSLLGVLTSREREVLKLLAEGKSNRKIAALLGISVRTVEHHRSSVMKKTDVSNVAGLIHYAIKTGLIELA
jgi:DNA-binding NarL/FixJ family response regulator